MKVMNNIYSRLVRDENDHTEALVDLFERLLCKEPEKFRDFLSQVLLGNSIDEGNKRNSFLDQLEFSSDEISLETQFRTPEEVVPDLVVFLGSRPVCVVEVKISEWNAARVEEQLRQYDAFLHESEEEHGNPTALVLLTPVTSLPEGFVDPDCDAYQVGLRGVVYWFKVAGWFRGLSREENGVGEPLKTLAREFSEFLESRTMPTLDDFAIARHYFKGSHTALTTALEVMNEQAVALTPGWSQHQSGYGPVGIYRWRNPPGDATRWISYGLCFSPVDENDECLYGFQRYQAGALNDPQPIQDGFYVFVEVVGPSEECQRIPGYSENQWYQLDEHGNVIPAAVPLLVDSTGWYHYLHDEDTDGYYARICPVNDLLDEDSRVGNELQDWAHESLERAVELWHALFGGDG